VVTVASSSPAVLGAVLAGVAGAAAVVDLLALAARLTVGLLALALTGVDVADDARGAGADTGTMAFCATASPPDTATVGAGRAWGTAPVLNDAATNANESFIAV